MGKAGQIEGLGGAGGGVPSGLMGGAGVSGHGLRDSARTRRGALIGVGQGRKRLSAWPSAGTSWILRSALI